MPAQPRIAATRTAQAPRSPLRTLRPLALSLALVAAGCGGGGGQGSTSNVHSLTGSVGDGPVVNASLSVHDAKGALVATGKSDAAAHYRLDARPGSFPLTVTASGGTDLVTNRPLDFELSAVALDASQGVANLNPFSTLIAKAARLRGLSTQSVADVSASIHTALNFGLEAGLADSMNAGIATQQVANLVVASEALAETLRRVAGRLAARGLDATAVLDALAGDLSDGRFDGKGSGADPQVSAAVRVAAAQVLLEALRGDLKVDGRSAAERLDAAIATTTGTGVAATALDWNPRLRAQLLGGLAAAQALTPSQPLATLSAGIAGAADGGQVADLSTTAPDADLALGQAMSAVVDGDTPTWSAAIAAAPSTGDTGTAAPGTDTGSGAGSTSGDGSTSTGGNTGGTTSGDGSTSTGGSTGGGTTSGDGTSSSGGTTSGGDTATQPAQLAVTNITRTGYSLSQLDFGELMFSDRDYVFTDIPRRYIGMERVLTAKEDRTSTGAGFLSFDVNTPVTVYVAHADSIANKPAWLAGWTDTGDTLVDRSVYVRDFPAGTVTLGGNTADGIDNGSMYFTLVAPQGSYGSSDCATCTTPASIEISWDPVPGVTGYLVYAGTSADTVSDLVFDLGAESAGFDPNQPRVAIDPALDLGLSSTDGVHTCFAIKAYSDAGSSTASTPVCTTM